MEKLLTDIQVDQVRFAKNLHDFLIDNGMRNGYVMYHFGELCDFEIDGSVCTPITGMNKNLADVMTITDRQLIQITIPQYTLFMEWGVAAKMQLAITRKLLKALEGIRANEIDG